MKATVAPSGDHLGELSSGAGCGGAAPSSAAAKNVANVTSRSMPLPVAKDYSTKKAAKIETDLDFDAVQRIGLDVGLVDNKSAAIDEEWQAVRFVYRLEDR
jgi:hypothetical protein